MVFKLATVSPNLLNDIDATHEVVRQSTAVTAN